MSRIDRSTDIKSALKSRQRGFLLNPFRFGGGVPTDPNFANVSLLLHMDGTNGSTSFPDSSSNSLTVTAVGNAQISKAQNKFGGASGLFDGSGDWLSIAAGTVPLQFGAGDFTLEAWVYPITMPGLRYLIVGQANLSTAAGSSYVFPIGGGNCDFYVGSAARSVVAPVPSAGTWSHVAMCRQGDNLRSFLNGTLLATNASATGTCNVGTATFPNTIGALGNGGGAFNGYIDDLRITKGFARYTASFTPPTAPFPDS